VPDERARARIALDTNTNGGVTNRLTAAGSGVNGTTMAATGGDELLQAHRHTSPAHSHSVSGGTIGGSSSLAITYGGGSGPNSFPLNPAGIGISSVAVSISTTGSGAGQNVQPTIISFLPLIRAA
jgi:hypothetical protein